MAESSYCEKQPAVSLSPLSAKIQRGCSNVLPPIAPDWRHLAFIENVFLKKNYQMTGRVLLCSTRVIMLQELRNIYFPLVKETPGAFNNGPLA